MRRNNTTLCTAAFYQKLVACCTMHPMSTLRQEIVLLPTGHPTETPIPPADTAVLEDIMSRYSCHTVKPVPHQGVNRIYHISNADPERGVVAEEIVRLTVKIAGFSTDKPNLVPAAREAKGLQLLAKRPDPPLKIPALVEYNAGTGTRVMTKLAGYPETRHGFLGTNLWNTTGIVGKKAGEWIGWLNTTEPRSFAKHMEAIGPYFDWDSAIERVLGTFGRHKQYPVTSRLAQSIYDQHRAYYPDGSRGQETEVIQDDFRHDNLLFEKGYPTGAIDFEMLVLGSAERMMRRLHDSDGRMLQACIQAYQHTIDRPIDEKKVACWAAAQALIAVCNQLQQGIPNLSLFLKTQAWLMDLFPEENWTELCRPVVEAYVPQSGSWSKLGLSYYTDAHTPPSPAMRTILTTQETVSVSVADISHDLREHPLPDLA